MTVSEGLNASLEAVAETMGDPTDAVYARIFSDHPDMEKLFVLDTNGSARGNMLNEALAALIDHFDGDSYGGAFIEIEINNHEGFGVPASVFSTFFRVIRDTFKDGLGAAWTADMDTAWTTALEHADKLCEAGAPA